MSRWAWLSLGFALGVQSLLVLLHALDQLDERSKAYVRPAGSPVVVNTGRKPA